MTGIVYSAITLATSTLGGVISGWLLYFYLPPGGTPLVPAALYGLVLLVSRLVNIVAALPIGYISDGTRSRWGRRIPYIFGGAVFLPILFILLWTPPHSGTSPWNLLYVAVILVLFNISYQVHQIPYEALLPELLPDEKQRINISAWRMGFQLLGAVLAGIAGPLIEKAGYFHTAVLLAVGTAPFLFLPMLFLREKTVPAQKRIRISMKESIRFTLRNRSFQTFAISWGLFWIASMFEMETLPYIVTEICRSSEADTVYFYIPAVLLSLACFPAITWLAKRFGKQRIYGGSLLAGAVIMPGLMLIGEHIPIPLMAQGIIWVSLESIALSGAMVLPIALAAEITDLDEKITGQRREGSFYAFWGLLDQLASGIGSALVPLALLLGRSASDPGGPLGVRFLGVLGGAFLLAAFLVSRSGMAEKSNGAE